MKASSFNRWFGRGWLSAGYLFLYLPIVALVVFSFNDSPIPNVSASLTSRLLTDSLLNGPRRRP